MPVQFSDDAQGAFGSSGLNGLPDSDKIADAAPSLEDQLRAMMGDDGEIIFGNGESGTDKAAVEETDPATTADPTTAPEPAAPATDPQTAPEPTEVPEGPEQQPGEEGEPATPPSSESPLDIVEFEGRKITRAQAQGLLNVYEWAINNPQEAALVDAFIQGQATITPNTSGASPSPTPTTAPAAGAPVPVTEPAVDPYAGLDPALAQRLRDIETVARYSAVQQEADQQERLRQDANTAQAVVASTMAEFKQRFALTDEQMTLLENTAAGANILPGLRMQIPDLKTAVSTALEMTFWATPSFRQAELQRQAEALATQHKKQNNQANLIGARGGVGSTPKPVDQPRARPTNRDERNTAMAAEIAQHLSGAPSN